MGMKEVSSDAIKIYENTQVKLKTDGNSKHCLIQNISKDKYTDKATGEIKKRNL